MEDLLNYDEYNKTIEEVASEVVENVGEAEKTLRTFQNYAASRMTASSVPQRLLDSISVYSKAIHFFKQHQRGTLVTVNGETESQINEAIKEAMHG